MLDFIMGLQAVHFQFESKCRIHVAIDLILREAATFAKGEILWIGSGNSDNEGDTSHLQTIEMLSIIRNKFFNLVNQYLYESRNNSQEILL
jgi:hypothetical protein